MSNTTSAVEYTEAVFCVRLEKRTGFWLFLGDVFLLHRFLKNVLFRCFREFSIISCIRHNHAVLCVLRKCAQWEYDPSEDRTQWACTHSVRVRRILWEQSWRVSEPKILGNQLQHFEIHTSRPLAVLCSETLHPPPPGKYLECVCLRFLNSCLESVHSMSLDG